jgi:tagaturonate reductase
MNLLNKVNVKTLAYNDELPVRILQFGEGNFLRAFIDWMVHSMNKQGLFNGRVAVVQPISHGMVDALAKQDYLYTLLLRGVRKGEVAVETEVIESIARGVNPYAEFNAYLEEAANPDLRIIVSNTTEAGIELRPEDKPTDVPPSSFPAKLLCLMRRRYECFKGDAKKGFLIFPCELIERNGDTLKQVVCTLAESWYPGDTKFLKWLAEANVYFNTLVDRIVSGYPAEEADHLCREFNYQDNFIDTGEIFHFLAIEGPIEYESEFPLVQAGFNVKWCDNLTPYRTRKVRILNGAHTMTVLAAHLYGLTTVKDCMDDALMSAYIRRGIFDEIIPTLDLPEDELTDFGKAVLERFSNPYIRHQLLSISLNSVSKFKTRVLPSLLEYQKRKGELPELLTFSLAALLLFYRGTEWRNQSLMATRTVDNVTYPVNDNPEILKWFYDCWQEPANIFNLVQQTLAKTDFWGRDLNTVHGLTKNTSSYLQAMIDDGVPSVLKRIVK